MWAHLSNVLVGVIAAITIIMVHELVIDKDKVAPHRQISASYHFEPTPNIVRNMTSKIETNMTCTFVISCGRGDTDTIEEMKPLIVSAILLSTCALKFILMTDKESAERAHDLFRELQTTMKPLTIEIWVIGKKYIRKKAKGIKYDIYNHHSGWWGTTKLFVPWILRDSGYRRVIVLDADMLFIQDPRLLWVHVDESEDDDAQPWAYQMPLNDMSRASTICSCIVVMDIPRILENDFYPTKFLNVLRNHSEVLTANGRFAPPHGDQGLYYFLSHTYPELFRSLPQRFNIDHCHNYYESLTDSSADPVSLIHYNCGNSTMASTEPGNKLFDFYRNYRWSWLKGYATLSYPVYIRRKKFP